jgi:hypothetical protein
MFFADKSCRKALEAIDQTRDRDFWWISHKQMNMIFFAVEFDELSLEI